MSQTTGTDVQVSIERMVMDLVRVPCSKVLLSPEMHRGVIDRVVARNEQLGLLAFTGSVNVRGVPTEKCVDLSGTEYALVPKQPVVPDEQRPFHHFDTQKLLVALGLARVRVDSEATMEFVAGAMLDPEVRKRVLEARVFEPE